MKVKCKVNFYPEKRFDKETDILITENVPVFMFFTYNGKRLIYYTGYRLNSETQWNPEKQRMKPNTFNQAKVSSTLINGHLDELQARVQEIYMEYITARKQAPPVQYLRDELKTRMEIESPGNSFFDILTLFIQTASVTNDWTAGTVTKFNTLYKQLKEFQEKKHFKIEFENIDENFFNRFHAFLREEHNHRNTTLSKNLKIFKWFLNWATNHKYRYNTNLAFRSYKPKFKGVKAGGNSDKIIFLRWDELMKVYNKKIKKEYLARVRDVFCFQCFTGLRYSDVYNLKRANIKKDTIEFTTIKTEDKLIIDLNQYSRAILDKYKDIPFKDDKALPVISNQNYNVYLKELGEYCELNELETIVYFRGDERKEETLKRGQLLTTHVARKTFVSNALFFGIPAEVIMAWTGHKSHEMLERYYKITGLQKAREMAKFDNGKTEENGK